jgi:hypothetical protein
MDFEGRNGKKVRYLKERLTERRSGVSPEEGELRAFTALFQLIVLERWGSLSLYGAPDILPGGLPSWQGGVLDGPVDMENLEDYFSEVELDLLDELLEQWGNPIPEDEILSRFEPLARFARWAKEQSGEADAPHRLADYAERELELPECRVFSIRMNLFPEEVFFPSSRSR